MQKALALCLWVFIALNSTNAVAQFAVTEDFRGGTNPNIIIGNDARLTSGNPDPVNQGWLRLTRSTTNLRGNAYIDTSFPSTLGVLVDFEYKTWRDVDDSYNGADGLGVFLFDGNIDSSTFALGGDGGALSYAKKDSTPGLRGGYVGIGFDEYGNFANPSDGGKFGGPGERPNSVVLRGPTTTNNSATVVNDPVLGPIQPTNNYLFGKTILPNGTGFSYVDITANTGARGDNVIDYNTRRTTRPGDALFYRRVQIEIKRLASGGQYDIIVRWKTTPTATTFDEILRYTTNDIPPALLKVGFAASTGGGVNYHEIRNLLVTTPNNMRVIKKADKEILSKVTESGTDNQITYTIEVTNDTSSMVPSIAFYDGLTDADGTLIPRSNGTTTGFYIDTASITTTGFTSASLTASSTTSEITGTLAMAPNTTGIIKVTGRLIGMIPQGNLLTNTVTVTPPFDEDMNNNTYKVDTPVISENADLVLNKIDLNNACVGTSTTAKSFELRVSNVGTAAATYRRVGRVGQRIVVTKVVPTSYNYNDSATPNGFTTDGTARWSRYTTTSGTNTIYTYVARYPSGNSDQTLDPGTTYETTSPIRYTINVPPGVNYEDVARVSYRVAVSSQNGYDGAETAEVASNRFNNTASSWIYATPATPGVSNVTYCQGDTPAQLTATGTYSLRWYFSATGGTASNFAPTPTTTAAGTQTYWVSQLNGSCESSRAQITVTVNGKPTAGVIAGNQNICNNNTPNPISSTTDGTVTGSGNLTYRWQSFSAPSNTWNTITGPGSNLPTYTPGNLTTTTRYRRITVSTNGSNVCVSDTSNEVTISVSIPTTAGTIAGDQNICSGGTPTTLSPTGTLAAGTGTLTYRWESFSAPTNAWATAGSGASYSPGPLTTTTRFRRITIATSTISGNTVTCPSVPSNEVLITVSAVPVVGNIVANQNICNGGTPVAITSGTNGAGTGTGDISYAWQSSTNGGSSWSGDISGATEASYTPGPLTQTTQFKRFTIATNGTAICRTTGSTNSVTITVLPVISPGSVTPATQTICMDTRPVILTGSALATTGSIASVTYRWESSPTNDVASIWTTIPGAISNNYHPPISKKTTYYRRTTIATSTTTAGITAAVCESATSTPVVVTTKNCVVITNPMIYQKVN